MSGAGDGERDKYDLDKLLEWDEEMMWNFVNSIGGSDDKYWSSAPSSLKAVMEEPPVEKTCRRKSTTTVGGYDGRRRESVAGHDHDLHILTERMRRKKMRSMFSSLHQLLPHVSPKADKSTIIDEAVNQIKKLEVKVQDLERQKQDRLRAAAYSSKSTTSSLAASEPFDEDDLMVDGIPSVSSTTVTTPAAGPATSSRVVITDHANSTAVAVPQFTTWSHPNVVLNICGDEAMFNICAVKKPGLLTAICGVLERYKIDVVATYVSSDLPNQSKFMIHCRAITACASSRFTIEAFPAEERYYQTAKEMLLLLSP